MAVPGWFGLQARMTASYVLVTAAAVLVVEAIAIGVILPSYLAGQDLTNRVLYTAGDMAERVGVASLSTTSLTLPQDFVVGAKSSLGPGQVQDQGQGLVVPQVTDPQADSEAPFTVAVVFTSDGTILASSYRQRFPVGGSIFALVPAGPKSMESGVAGMISDTAQGNVAWAVQPVMVQLAKNRGVVQPGFSKTGAPDGFVY